MLNRFHSKWQVGLLISGLLIVVIVSGAFFFHINTTPKAHPSTSLLPASASPGGTVFVIGSNYPSHDQVKVYFQTPSQGVITAQTDTKGSFSVPLTVPLTYVQGTKYYVHVDNVAYSTQLLFNFARLNLSLTNPTTQPTFGATTQFTGTGFKPNEKINLTWNNGKGTLNIGTVVAGSDGSFSTTLTPPSIPYLSQYQLVATGNTSGFKASIPISGTPGIVYDPTAAPAGTTVNVTGGSFGSGEAVNITFFGSTVAAVTADKNGTFKTSFVVRDSDQIGYQDNALVATGLHTGGRARGGFDREPTIQINPNHGGPGTQVHISGKHFTPNGEVRIYLVSDKEHESRVDRCLLADIHASSSGTFSITVTIPNGDCLEDISHIIAIDVHTGDRVSVLFNGQDNDEGNED